MSKKSKQFIAALLVPCLLTSATAAERSTAGLQVLYDFAGNSGDVVVDRAGVGRPINLAITNPKAVERVAGSIKVFGETQFKSDKPSARLVESIRRSGEVSIEAMDGLVQGA